MFDNVTIISPTIKTTRPADFYTKIFKGSCYTEYSDDVIDKVERQLQKIENKEDTSYLIVLDDFLGQTSKMGRKNNKIAFHACRFRHYVELR